MEPFVAIDFETSDYASNSACSVGLVRVENGEITRELCKFIRPPQRFMMFTHIHGLRWEDVAEAPTFGELWPELAPFFADVNFIAAHNASFDRGVLRGCCETYALSAPETPFRCTVQIARRAFGIYPSKLSNVCRVLGIELNHHEALSDARACAQIVIRAHQLQTAIPEP